jgi:hypothetical protein
MTPKYGSQKLEMSEEALKFDVKGRKAIFNA